MFGLCEVLLVFTLDQQESTEISNSSTTVEPDWGEEDSQRLVKLMSELLCFLLLLLCNCLAISGIRQKAGLALTVKIAEF